MIRKASVSDVAEIHRVRLQVRENVLSDPNRVTHEDTVDAITVSGRGWVYEDEGRILGFSVALKRDPSIWALFVLPEHEGRGIGGALHDAAVQWLWSEGAPSIWLGTDPGTRAERFYRRRGWRDAGRRENGEIRMELERGDANSGSA